MESWVQSWWPRANAFCDFSTRPVWSTAPATKKCCQVIRSAAPVTQNHPPKTEDLMLQNATLLRKSVTWPPNISDEHVSCTAPATKNASANAPRLPSFLEMRQNSHVLLTFGKVHNPSRWPRETTSERPKVVWHLVFLTFWPRNVLRATTAYTFSTSQLPKVVRGWCVAYILTWKCASRQRGVHFCDISTSKKVSRPSVFNTFDLEMCFAPQPNVLFRDHNFQKWSEHGVLCAFWLPNVLRA